MIHNITGLSHSVIYKKVAVEQVAKLENKYTEFVV